MRASNVGMKLNRLACYLTNRRSEKKRSDPRGTTDSARDRVPTRHRLAMQCSESTAERMKGMSLVIRARAMAMLLWWSLAARLELGLGCLAALEGFEQWA